MDAAADARKQLALAEEELRKGRAAKAGVETKIAAEKRVIDIATARRSSFVANLGQSSSDADTTKWHRKIDEEDEKIKNSTRLLEALTRQLECVNEEIKVFETDRQRFRQDIAAAEKEVEFKTWAAQSKQQVQEARQKLDGARAAYGTLSVLFESGKEKFGARAMFVLEPLLQEFSREQHNPTANGWRNVVGSMLNGVTIHPMQRG